MTQREEKWYKALSKAENIVDKVFDDVCLASRGSHNYDSVRFAILMAKSKLSHAITELILQ